MFIPNLMSSFNIPPLHDNSLQPPKPQPPTQNAGRAPGDFRSVSEITSGPLFKNLMRTPDTPANSPPLLEGKRIDDFYWQIGGNWNDPSLSSEKRADLAANAERVLQFIDQSGEGPTANNNNIDGISAIRPRMFYDHLKIESLSDAGSEARTFLNFSKNGYSALQSSDNTMKPTHRPTETIEQRIFEPDSVAGDSEEATVAKFPSPHDQRPPEDTRSAEDIYMGGSPYDFLTTSDDRYPTNDAEWASLLSDLKKIVGNFGSDNPDQAERSDAMYKLEVVTDFLASKIEADPHSENAMYKAFFEFSKRGYPALEEHRNIDQNDSKKSTPDQTLPAYSDMIGRGLGTPWQVTVNTDSKG